ncbi:PREDICTED: F-box only protein 7 isoform X2 [Cyprinodon variegatus]|uniref:F-box only protein 7 isoform X2 n=1 Tax=Cyprinodon variegatus TaxID=28743 RepID=UPI000742A752|nr:PREDICTED: F-box only protein 7 isoform X2 [Cyprinodon variegatus]
MSMKLRVRINRQTSRVELPGEEPTLQELSDLIKQTLLSCNGHSADTEFSLSLNGSELLSESDQTLSACGIVSGDLITVLLPQPPPGAMATSEKNTMADRQEAASGTTSQPQSSSSGGSTSAPPTAPPQTSDLQDFEAAPPVWEPMLCGEAEDGEAPLSLELLYHTAQVACPNDAIMVAAHLLMLETGFTPQGSELKPGEMPAGWRSAGGVYRLQYNHHLCGDSLVSVVAVGMGPLLVINVVLKVTESIDTTRKLQLNPSSYVTHEWPENAAAAFKDLKKLSRILKDQLAYPLIAAAREAMALPVVFGLQALPPELLLRVLRLLDVRSVVRLSAASWQFNAAASDSTLWKHLYLRDFSNPDRSRSRDTDWKQLYKKSYKLRSELRHPVRPYSLPPYPLRDIITPVPRPLFPPLPGIIGGDYDQRPNLPPNLLPHPRYDPIGPLLDPAVRRPRLDFRRPAGGRPSDIRRGFI